MITPSAFLLTVVPARPAGYVFPVQQVVATPIDCQTAQEVIRITNPTPVVRASICERI